ncbi:MAG: nucleotidyl transferase AbiEii/AbiGii toxin family protein [Candidatus Omnitrophota bacterium]
MDKDFALSLSSQIGIDVQQIVREEAELIVLKRLFESPISGEIIFKGGTALRLIYNSPRFSEDLNFTAAGAISSTDFKNVVNKIIAFDPRFSLKDLAAKFHTHLAEFKIKESWLEIPFSLKIEISKRPVVKITSKDQNNALAKSPSTNITVLTKACTIERILQDKLRMLKERKMPRDIFDAWFICQKTGMPFTQKKLGFPKNKIRQELRKFLPRSYYPVVDELEKLNA